MDRRIKAILIANDIKVEKIKIVGFKDEALEIIENGESVYLTLDGKLNENKPAEIVSQDDKLEEVINDAKDNIPSVTIIEEIIEEVDDDLFAKVEEVDDDIDLFNVDLEDNFDIDKELKKEEKVKEKKKKKKGKKGKDDDDLVNFF